MFGAANVQPMKSSDTNDKNSQAGNGNGNGGIQSGVDKTKKSNGAGATDADSNTSIENNEFPESSIDEMRAQMELVLSRYIQEAERREAMRIKMSESDAQTLLSDAAGTSGHSNGGPNDEYDSKAYDDNKKSRSSTSSNASKVKKSHK